MHQFWCGYSRDRHSRRQRKKPKESKTNAQCRVGRTYKEFVVLCNANDITEWAELEMIEKYRPDPIHNSTLKVPRGIRVFYCDPYCSSQKPHVNSYSRGVLDGRTAYAAISQG